MALLRYKILIFFSFIFCTGLFGHSFYKPFIAIPIQYRGTYIGFSDQHVFSISNAKNQLDWTSQDKVLPQSPLFVHFNRVFFLNDASHIVALDYQFGQKIWESIETVSSFEVSYPYVLYQGKTGVLGGIDFSLGKPVWQKTFSKSIDHMEFIGQSGCLGVVTGGDLALLYAHNGEEIKRIDAPKKLGKIVANWNNGLIFDNDSRFDMFLLDKKSFVKSDVVPTKNGSWFDEHYYITYDESQHLLKTVEVETNQSVWIESNVPTKSVVYYAFPYVLAQTPSNNIFVYHINNSMKQSLGPLHKGQSFDSQHAVYVDGTDIYLVSTSNYSVLSLDKQNFRRWMRLPWKVSQ